MTIQFPESLPRLSQALASAIKRSAAACVAGLPIILFASMAVAQVPARLTSDSRTQPADLSAEKINQSLRESIDLAGPNVAFDRIDTASRNDRIQAIQNKLRMLEQMMDERDAATMRPTPPSVKSSLPLPTNKQLQNIGTERLNRNPADADEPAETEDSNQPDPVYPDEWSEPVDVKELARSLFLSGRWQDALKNYRYFHEKYPLEFQQDAWSRCAMASCYSALGDWSTAESHFREVIATKDDSYSVEISRWYLGHLAQRRKLSDAFQALDKESAAILQSKSRGTQR